MPTYCYTSDDGVTVDRFFSMDDHPDLVVEDGITYTRDLHAEQCPRRAIAEWPICSDAAGVNPSQRMQAQAHSVRIGVPTEFNKAGQAVFRSPQHRRDYCKAIGLRDLNGGYSDP